MVGQRTNYCFNRMSLGIILLLFAGLFYFVLRPIMFGFTIWPWTSQSHVLCHPSHLRYELYLMQWALSQIDFFTPTDLCHHYSRICMHDNIVESKGFVARLVFIFLFRQPTEYLTISKALELKVEIVEQLDFCMFKELCRCCLQQYGLAVSLQKLTYCLGNSMGLSAIPMGPLCAITQLNVTQSRYWKLHFMARDIQLGLFIPHYLKNSLGLPICILRNVH